jgi:hypothetical protein
MCLDEEKASGEIAPMLEILVPVALGSAAKLEDGVNKPDRQDDKEAEQSQQREDAETFHFAPRSKHSQKLRRLREHSNI